MAKRRSKRSKTRGKSRLPSWSEVRAGLMQHTKIRLLAILGRIYLSKSTPRSMKLKIVSMAKLGIRRVSKVRRKSKARKGRSRKHRSPAQIRATRKLVAFNKRRR